uniref:hypothetical protein n=1 Tax=Paractinoplanes polyasparticus TaxID=2856853 RepID=UPI001C854F14|nr:hypothetical protein [Actinoplanes polyasparticus]
MAQYLMLGGAGLASIPVVLLWSSDKPPATATHLVAAVSVMGIAAVPFLVSRAMKIVDAGWLRTQRLSEVRRTVDGLVREEAIERIALNRLHEVSKTHSIEVRTVFHGDVGITLEKAVGAGSIFDINLTRLLSKSRSAESLRVLATIGDRVNADTPLLAGKISRSTGRQRTIFALTPRRRDDRLANLLAQIKEEGLEAVRSESSSGVTAVADTYTELWLALPRAWAAYGQRLAGDFLNQFRFFTLTPMDALRKDLWALLDVSIEKGLRDHSTSLLGVSYQVGSEAIELDAPDVLNGAVGLARSALRFPREGRAELAELVNSLACRYQLELCRFSAIPRLQDSGRTVQERRQASDATKVLFKSITESLRWLLENGQVKLFEEIDREFMQLLRYWRPESDDILARQILKHPDLQQSSGMTEAQARQAIEVNEMREELISLRATLRMSLLGWGLHISLQQPLGDEVQRVLVNLARSLNDLNLVQTAVELAFERDKGPLSDWVMSALPSGEAHFIDDEGPLLRAIALLLFTNGSPSRIPPSGWMTQARIDRVKYLVEELATQSLLEQIGLDANSAQSSASAILQELDEARRRQVDLERESLIAQALDPAKVDEFRAFVIEAWKETRLVPSLLELCDTPITPIDLESLQGKRLGFPPKLEPKGLFVNPTNFVGLDHHAREYGRGLAFGELEALIKAIEKNSPKLTGKGPISSRLEQTLQKLKDDGYSPSLIVLPSDHQVLSKLGLPPRWQREHEGGKINDFFVGEILGIPAIGWRTTESDRLYAIDVSHFAEIGEVLDENGNPALPTCDIRRMDLSSAEKTIRHWNRGRNTPPANQMTVDDIQASVRVDVQRPFRIRVLDSKAARSVWIPPTARRKRTAQSGPAPD